MKKVRLKEKQKNSEKSKFSAKPRESDHQNILLFDTPVMAFAAANLKSLISIKLKKRHDDYTDQVSRIIVAKIFVVASIVVGIDWFHDNVTCIPPPKAKITLPDSYLESACWVKGFFIYPHLADKMGDSGYFGIPSDLMNDGVLRNSNGQLCQTEQKLISISKTTPGICQKMPKYYFLQYQWMPVFIISMGAMFYFPYIIFRFASWDIISLRLNMKDDAVTCDDIVQTYFNHTINSVCRMRFRIVLNFAIKVLYVFVNVFAFTICDSVLNHQFRSYGVDWLKWSRLNSTQAYDFEVRDEPTPGNRMLPTFGMCQLVDSRRSLTNSFTDKVIVICEISSNILYQYMFLVLWFVLVFSIAISCLGMLIYLWNFIHVAFFIKNEKSSKYVYKFLTYRECQYLEFVRRRDLVMYGVIISKLRELHSLPLPMLRKDTVKKKDASAPLINNGMTRHHLKRLDSIELGT